MSVPGLTTPSKAKPLPTNVFVVVHTRDNTPCTSGGPWFAFATTWKDIAEAAAKGRDDKENTAFCPHGPHQAVEYERKSGATSWLTSTAHP